MEDDVILKMENITKEFPGVKALDNISLELKRGEVLGLLGENGSGKSTLMNCLMGVIPLTSGKIYFDGQLIGEHDVIDSHKLHMVMIHQELSPIPDMTVMENIWLGREPKNALKMIDYQKMEEDTLDLFSLLSFDLNPRIKMRDLSVAGQQIVEIAKAVSYDAKLIIMDEPTSSLTSNEIDDLFKIVKRLTARKVSVIYISHKLDEIFAICDRVTILRDGEYITSRPIADYTKSEMVALMVGREIKQMYPDKTPNRVKDELTLEVKNVSDGEHFHNISFKAHKGEIIGFAGLVGTGRTELMETIFGFHHFTEGTITLNGQQIVNNNSSDAIDNGFAFLTDDRRNSGIFPMLSVEYNIDSSSLGDFKKADGLLDLHAMKTSAEEASKDLSVKTPSIKTPIENLSGGNQQKALIAKWLMTNPEILIIDEPTRGIDVGAKFEIYELLEKFVAEGKTILMVSSEMPEILGMSDTIVVMKEGYITGILPNDEKASQEYVMEYATGIRNDFNKGVDIHE